MHPGFTSRKLEFYREAYDKQIERREHALERFSHIITIHTLVGGLIAYYASEIPDVSTEVCFLLFAIPASIGSIVYFVGLILLVIALHKGTTLQVLPPPEEYDRVFASEQNRLPDTKEADAALVAAFESGLSDQYRELATLNQAASNIRDSKYSRISRFGVWSLLLLIVSAPAFFVLKKQDSSKPDEIVVTKPIKIMPPQNQSSPSSTPSNQSPQPAQQASATTSPPSPPPSVKFVMPESQPLNESFAAQKKDIQTMERKDRN
jgi:hypothetical protein